MAKKNNELTAESLKQSLWATLLGVRSKKIDPKHANAIASQSREIMRIVRAEIQIAQMPGVKLAGFISPPGGKKKKGRTAESA